MALLDVQRVTKRFRGVTALDAISLAVEAGEVVGVIGPNGAGKTTLYNVISGFLPADGGNVRFRQEEIAGRAPNWIVTKGLARTFQIPRPFRQLSVVANLLVVRPAGGGEVDRRRDAAEEVLELVGLGEKAEDPAGTLSQGQLKRLEVARALAARPSLLLLDEPFAGLGTAEIPGLSALLRRLHAGGMTLVIIEHKLRELMALAQRVFVMDYGTVIAEGSPEAVVRDARVLAAYLGSAPDNAECGSRNEE